MSRITFIGILIGSFFAQSEGAIAQTLCSDKSSPRECYEAGLTQVGGALAELKRQSDNIENIKRKLMDENEKLRRELNSLRDESARNVDELERHTSSQIGELSAKVTALESAVASLRKMKVTTAKFYRGEYNKPGDYGPRYDPRDEKDPQAIGKRFCPANASVTVSRYRNEGGGCCGYDYWNVVCTSFD